MPWWMYLLGGLGTAAGGYSQAHGGNGDVSGLATVIGNSPSMKHRAIEAHYNKQLDARDERLAEIGTSLVQAKARQEMTGGTSKPPALKLFEWIQRQEKLGMAPKGSAQKAAADIRASLAKGKSISDPEVIRRFRAYQEMTPEDQKAFEAFAQLGKKGDKTPDEIKAETLARDEAHRESKGLGEPGGVAERRTAELKLDLTDKRAEIADQRRQISGMRAEMRKPGGLAEDKRALQMQIEEATNLLTEMQKEESGIKDHLYGAPPAMITDGTAPPAEAAPPVDAPPLAEANVPGTVMQETDLSPDVVRKIRSNPDFLRRARIQWPNRPEFR